MEVMCMLPSVCITVAAILDAMWIRPRAKSMPMHFLSSMAVLTSTLWNSNELAEF